jgi:hypothetical protein
MHTTTDGPPLAGFPDDARLWVFPSADPLDAEQARRLMAEVDAFLEGWEAHRHPVVGGRALLESRFLLIGADERATGVSGCSIDSLFRRLVAIERELGTTLTDASPVWYRERDGAVACVPRAEFRRLAADGGVTADTVVFDSTIASVGALRAGGLERRASESWHARLLPAAR